MSLTLLRIALLIELFACLGAMVCASRLMDWRSVPSHQLANSPDAAFFIEGLLVRWSALSGLCIGIALCLALVAFGQRAALLSRSAFVKAHWLAAGFPVLAVLWATAWLW